MSDIDPTPRRTERTSGWEKADAVAHGAGRVLDGTAWLLMKGYAVVLVVLGIVLFVLNPGALWWAALLCIGYGVYLLAPGSKFVVW